MEDTENRLQGSAIDNDSINLVDYVKVVFKHRKMVLRLTIAASFIAGFVSILSPKYYAATVSVVPPIQLLQEQSDLAGGLALGSSSMLKKAIGITSIANLYVGFLKSRVVEDAVIDRFDLMKVYGVGSRVEAHRKLQQHTTIKTPDDNILRVTIKDKDPQRAAAIANGFVEELDRQNKRLSAGQATSKRIFLENRLKEIEQKLGAIDNILSREAKTQEMLFELLTREYEIAKIEEARSMPTIQVLDKAIAPEKRMARGTVRKMLVTAVAVFSLAVLGAFVREYFAGKNGPAGSVNTP